jgi:tRNA pseudouridine38-40 synthase
VRNIKLTIEYDGTRYCGWQTQRVSRRVKRNISIQEIIEKALKKILKHKVNLTASGRTDSGVHALAQVANFKTQAQIPLSKLRLALNGNLPKDIRIKKAEEVNLEFHAQYWAKSKVYRYYILNQEYKTPFFSKYYHWVKFPLDIKLMQKRSKDLKGRHDFKGFCASGSTVMDTVRTVKKVSLKKIDILSCNLVCFEIEADGFLYNMVRNIVGTLIDIGRKRFPPDRIKKVFTNKDRSLAGPCVPAKGLFLAEVKY